MSFAHGPLRPELSFLMGYRPKETGNCITRLLHAADKLLATARPLVTKMSRPGREIK